MEHKWKWTWTWKISTWSSSTSSTWLSSSPHHHHRHNHHHHQPDHPTNHVSRMHVDRADCHHLMWKASSHKTGRSLSEWKKQDWHHHLLPLALVEGAKEAGNEHVELPDLLLVVVLQRVLVTLLQPREGCAHLMLLLKTEKNRTKS